MRRYNRSRKRDRILQIMQETGGHLTAYDVFELAKADYPALSLGTVYRNLTLLAERGDIRKLGFFKDFDRFDARTDDHDHFLCESCGNIYDLHVSSDAQLAERVRRETQHDPNHYQLEFFGTCKNCLTTKSGAGLDTRTVTEIPADENNDTTVPAREVKE